MERTAVPLEKKDKRVAKTRACPQGHSLLHGTWTPLPTPKNICHSAEAKVQKQQLLESQDKLGSTLRCRLGASVGKQ